MRSILRLHLIVTRTTPVVHKLCCLIVSSTGSSQGIKYLTSSPHCPQRNDIIERQVRIIKCILNKIWKIQSFQESLAHLRETLLENELPSPTEILHGRDHLNSKASQIHFLIRRTISLNIRGIWLLVKSVNFFSLMTLGSTVLLQVSVTVVGGMPFTQMMGPY